MSQWFIYFDAVEADDGEGGGSSDDVVAEAAALDAGVDDGGVGGSIVSHGQTLHAVLGASKVVSSCFVGSLGKKTKFDLFHLKLFNNKLLQKHTRTHRKLHM